MTKTHFHLFIVLLLFVDNHKNILYNKRNDKEKGGIDMLLREGIVFDKDTIFEYEHYSKGYGNVEEMIKNEFGAPITNSDKKREKYIRNYTKENEQSMNVKYNVSRIILFCPCCHKPHCADDCLEGIKRTHSVSHSFFDKDPYENTKNKKTDNIMYITYNQKFERKDFESEEFSFQCPSCGYKFTRPLQWLNENKTELRNSLYLHSYHIYQEEDRLILSLIAKKYILLRSIQHIHAQTINFRIVFNLKTRQSYSLRPVVMNEKKDADKINEFYQRVKIMNITYPKEVCNGDKRLPYFITRIEKESGKKELQKVMAEIMLEKTGNDITGGIPFYGKDLTESWLDNLIIDCVFANNFHHVSKSFLSISLSEITKISKKERLSIKKMMMEPSEENIKTFLRSYKGDLLECKSIKRRIMQTPFLLKYLTAIQKVGFCNKDVICGLLDDYDLCSILCDYSKDKFMSALLQAYIQKNGEAFMRKSLQGAGMEWYRDVYGIMAFNDMYLDDVLTDIVLRDVNVLTIKELHDKYCSLISLARRISPNKKYYYIPYLEKELDANMDIGEFSFRLAKDTGELEETGDKMHICVGGYSAATCTKQCNIIVVKNKNGKRVACIEYVNKDLIQFKGICNKKPDKAVTEAFKGFYKEMAFERCLERHLLEENLSPASYKMKKQEETGYLIVESYPKTRDEWIKKETHIEEKTESSDDVFVQRYRKNLEADDRFM